MIGEQRPFLFSLFTSIRRPSCASLVLEARGLCLSFFRWLAIDCAPSRGAKSVDHWNLRSITFCLVVGTFSLTLRRENGDRSTQNKIVIRGTLPYHYSIEPLDGSGLAVRTIFLLSVQEDGYRLVYAIRLDDEFDWSGDNLQTSQLLPEWTRKSP